MPGVVLAVLVACIRVQLSYSQTIPPPPPASALVSPSPPPASAASTDGAPPSTTPGCVLEFPSTDFWGHNLEIEARFNTTAERCTDTCIQTRGCLAFTMKNNGQCWLKTASYTQGPAVTLPNTLGTWSVQFCSRPTELLEPINPRDPTLPDAPVPGNTPAECAVLLRGIEFGGHDLEAAPRLNKSQFECASVCIATEGCAAVTSRADGSCFLKSASVAQAPPCAGVDTTATLLVQVCRKPGVTLPPQNPVDPAATPSAGDNSGSLQCLPSPTSAVDRACLSLAAFLIATSYLLAA